MFPVNNYYTFLTTSLLTASLLTMQITFHQVPCASLRLNRIVKMIQLHSGDFDLWFWYMGLILMSLQNYKTTFISFHCHRQWWYLQTQRTWIIHVNKASDNIHEIPLDFKTVLSHEKHQSRGHSDEENPANGVYSCHDWSLRNDELLVRFVRNQYYDHCRFVVHHRET